MDKQKINKYIHINRIFRTKKISNMMKTNNVNVGSITNLQCVFQ